MASIWYDKGKTLSYKAFFNLLIGNRGGGKTYGYKTWCIDDYKKNKKQFVWLRRYGTEIDLMRKDFFTDIQHLYPNDTFDCKGSRKSGKFYINGEVMGEYFALTTSSIAKSSPHPLVDKIIFDEFLIMGNTYKYLSDEVVLLLEFVETIFRNRENDPSAVQPRGVYMLGNNVTIANPYFLYFNIPNFRGQFYYDKKRGILAEKYCNQAFVEMKKKSSIGKLTAGTAYSEYSIENNSYLDNDRFIKPKPSKCEFYCAIDYKGRTYGFWIDRKQGDIYANMQYDPSSYLHFSLTKEDHSINTFLVKNINSSNPIRNLVLLFKAGYMFFENMQIKAQVYELLSYFVR